MAHSSWGLSSFSQQVRDCLRQLQQHLADFLTPSIPPEIFSSSADCLVHISDTPATLYPALFRLLKKLRPSVLIHTGDLVDQLKLENHTYLYNLYQAQMEQFIIRLEHLPVDTIYLVPGNHDDPNLINLTCRRCHVLPKSSLVEFGSFRLGLAHEPQHLPLGADFALYGHSLDKPASAAGHPLSGITGINVLLANGNIYSIPYPRGTDVARGIKTRPQKL